MAICVISSRPNAEMHQAIPDRSISCPISSSSGTSVASSSRESAAYLLRSANGAVARPVLGAQCLLVRLAETGQRQRLGRDDLLGRLDRALAVLDHLLDLGDHVVGELVALAQHDDCGDGFAPLLV